MNNEMLISLRWRVLLSSIWVFFTLSVLFQNIHEFFKGGFLDEIGRGTVNGSEISESLLLIKAFIVFIPLLMIFLSQTLSVSICRKTNITVALITIIVILVGNLLCITIGNGIVEANTIFFIIIQTMAMALIIRMSLCGPIKVSRNLPLI